MIIHAEEVVSETQTVINFADIIFTLGVFLILLLLMRKFVFKKVIKILDERANKISTEISQSEENLKLSEEKIAELDEQAKTSSSMLQQKLKEAQHDAAIEREKIVAGAKSDAQKMITEAEREIESKKESINAQSQKEAIITAFTLASEVLKKEISPDVNQKNIEEFLNKK